MGAHAVVRRGCAGAAALALGLAIAGACGSGGPTGPTCWTHVPWGLLQCCPIAWTADVPAGGNVLVNPDEASYRQANCTFTVETACAAGDCSTVHVRIASHDLAVPVVTQLAGDIAEIRAVSAGTAPARVTVAVSGECVDCL